LQKGVLLLESTLTAQALSLIEAWEYSAQDHLLHILPLHHIHGTVNALMAPLIAGCAIEFMFPFNPANAWQRIAAPFLPVNGEPIQEHISFLTAVPTIYNRLIGTHAQLSPELQAATKKAISPSHLRLNISGSAALPVSTQAAWTELSSGNTLLERYGMTEVGMALSCGLAMNDRVDGSVGWPLPSVEARLVDSETGDVVPVGDEIDADGRERTGEIQLRGPTVFQEYWRHPTATAAEFVDSEDGKGRWFKTGDIACRRTIPGAGNSHVQNWAHGPMYFILGRKSVDIIKTGGEKVSALEIERELLALPQIAEAAVVGLPSEQWGQKVAAVVVLHADQVNTGRSGKVWGVMDMRRALKDRLVNYKVPQELKVVEGGLPRNAMGKGKS
jgi:malonyl-CoA/methylmalonyl-CoA synthetase